MALENQRQLENTKAKLRELEELYAAKTREPSADPIRMHTIRSLRKRINQFKEEIVRFESHLRSATSSP